MVEVKFIPFAVWNYASYVCQDVRHLGIYLKILVQSVNCGPNDAA